MRATIHQPDFMPWFGFFNKIAKADLWIVLDHVTNNPRDAAFWGRRVRILVNGQPTWLSITLNKPKETGVIGIPICDMTINLSDCRIMEKCLKTVQMAYARTPYFAQHWHLVEAYFLDKDASLSKRNMQFIESVMQILSITTPTIRSSSLGVTTKSNQLLIDLLAKVGADTYLCGGGAQGYQQDDLFKENGIRLEYNLFQHPVYAQRKATPFVPGLSILDALFYAGRDAVATWIRSIAVPQRHGIQVNRSIS
jgi:hypothetical protein